MTILIRIAAAWCAVAAPSSVVIGLLMQRAARAEWKPRPVTVLRPSSGWRAA